MKSVRQECERAFEVDWDKLPELPAPWAFVQGYFGKNGSVRLIPASKKAYIRHKTPVSLGCKHKEVEEIPYKQGLTKLMGCKMVALKLRYMLTDKSGRKWVMDFFPESQDSTVETDVTTDHELKAKPEFLGREITGNRGRLSTKKQAKRCGPGEVQDYLEFAESKGRKDPYVPAHDDAEGKDFPWGSKK